MSIQEAYRKMQEASGIEVGDTVECIRAFKSNEMGCVAMAVDDRYVGKIYVVEGVPGGCIDTIAGYFPFFALKIIKKKQPDEKMVDVDGKEISLATVKAALKEYVK